MKKTLLIVLGEGGHTNQMLRLVDKLGNRYNYEYLIASHDKLSEKKIKIKGKIFKIMSPRKMIDKSLFITFLKFIPSSIQLFLTLLRSKSKAVISAGPALAIHTSWMSKYLFRKKVIFLESWSRVYSKSMAGKLIAPYADLTFIQWKEQRKNYPKALYRGRLG